MSGVKIVRRDRDCISGQEESEGADFVTSMLSKVWDKISTALMWMVSLQFLCIRDD